MAKVVTARDMLMSIILCTHRSDRYDDFEEALNSLYAQSYNKKVDESECIKQRL